VSAGLAALLLVAGYASLRVLELAPRSGLPVVEEEAPPTPALGAAWRAHVVLDGAQVLARLLPLHDEPALQAFRSDALRVRYGLPAGRAYRLYLSLAPQDAADAGAPLRLETVRVTGLAAFAELATRPAGPDSVYALFTAPLGTLEPGRARALLLWGELRGELDARPELELARAGATTRAVLEPWQSDEGEGVPRWYAGFGLARPNAEPPELAAEVARLERELAAERARRAERERAFLEFGRALSELPGGQALTLELQGESPVVSEPTPKERERAAAAVAARARAEEIGTALSALMQLEGVRGLDLLEPGTLLPGPPGALGPVVFRCLDERGGLAGSLRAERLRLEGSRAAHTLTLILEDGFESRGGVRVPFEGGARRITLPEVDPEPWRVECPELFEDEPAPAHDDGRWAREEVRRELNRLLALDTRHGWYRLHALGGVVGDELRDVALEELQADGRLARRLFADRLRLVLEDDALVLELSDGASVRGAEKRPFRDGTLRVVLPGAAGAAWRAASLPGLAPPPARDGGAPRGGG
jgi:hypothetical protein